jgi:glycosyltransferase involved in cell wall biosynthesis
MMLVGSGGRVFRPVSLGARRPSVSVVIPCYKYGHYLASCVRSATDQPGIDVEVIIVDDCSPDDSAAIAAELANRDSRIRVIRHEQNLGHIATYNNGLAAATGKYVTLVSADDLVAPEALTRAAALMEEHKSVGFIYGRCLRFSEQPPPVRSDAKAWIVWSGRDWLRLRCRSGYNVIASPEVVMRTSLLREIGDYRPDIPHSGDFEMWMRAASAADVGYVVGSDQAIYREHAANMHKTMFDSGNWNGQFIDLSQRADSFLAVFDGWRGGIAAARLEERARRTIAIEALDAGNYAFARGVDGFPYERFEDLARRLDSEIGSTRTGRAFARRAARQASRLPVHPLYAPRVVRLRLEEKARRWRRAQVGI